MKIDNYNASLLINSYDSNGNMAIDLIIDDGQPYCRLTTNLDYLVPWYAFVENNKMFTDFIEKYNLGKKTGASKTSGFKSYSLYEFNSDELIKHMNKNSDYLYLKYI